MIHGGYPSASARRSFGLGLACGLLLACAGFAIQGRDGTQASSATRAASPAEVDETAWRHPAPAADLASAVRVSAGLLSAAGPVVAHRVTGAATGGVPELLARAEEHRRKREFDQACALYAAVVAQHGMTADAWADYADALASTSGRLAGAPARAVEAALTLEPGHAKALWLRASLEHEEHRYAAALATWRRLLALVPPDSTDARIIEANIAEATRLAAG
jgi:tetratricopeptide (TPR) repeat protein